MKFSQNCTFLTGQSLQKEVVVNLWRDTLTERTIGNDDNNVVHTTVTCTLEFRSEHTVLLIVAVGIGSLLLT